MKSSRPFSIAPSILSADFTRLGEEVRAITRAGAQYVHVDVMDGQFVPNLTMGPDIVAALRRSTHLPLDVHLMIEKPEGLVPAFADAGAAIITVHAEASVHLHRTVQQIRELGARPGVSLNPATPLDVLDHVLAEIDLVLIMTVNPGFGGQKPIKSAIRKLAQARKYIAAARLKDPPSLEVDGGVKVDNAQLFCPADMFVSGSGIFLWPEKIELRKKSEMSEQALAESYTRAIQALRRKLHEGRRANDSEQPA